MFHVCSNWILNEIEIVRLSNKTWGSGKQTFLRFLFARYIILLNSQLSNVSSPFTQFVKRIILVPTPEKSWIVYFVVLKPIFLERKNYKLHNRGPTCFFHFQYPIFDTWHLIMIVRVVRQTLSYLTICISTYYHLWNTFCLRKSRSVQETFQFYDYY